MKSRLPVESSHDTTEQTLDLTYFDGRVLG